MLSCRLLHDQILVVVHFDEVMPTDELQGECYQVDETESVPPNGAKVMTFFFFFFLLEGGFSVSCFHYLPCIRALLKP